jgi:hypothetical protein
MLRDAPLVGQPRDYRRVMEARGLVRTDVTLAESDLAIFARCDVHKEAAALLRACRSDIESYIRRDPSFRAALRPLLALPGAPEIVRNMISAGAAAGVGPMAAVAGAIAEYVGRGLLPATSEVVVENGGDIFLITRRVRRVALWAGQSAFNLRLALEVHPQDGPLAVCTSSGTFGHSLSFGRADAAVAVSPDAALADAAATAIGNLVQGVADIEAALAFARSVPGLVGGLVVVGDQLGAWGPLRLVDPSTAYGGAIHESVC